MPTSCVAVSGERGSLCGLGITDPKAPETDYLFFEGYPHASLPPSLGCLQEPKPDFVGQTGFVIILLPLTRRS